MHIWQWFEWFQILALKQNKQQKVQLPGGKSSAAKSFPAKVFILGVDDITQLNHLWRETDTSKTSQSLNQTKLKAPQGLGEEMPAKTWEAGRAPFPARAFPTREQAAFPRFPLTCVATFATRRLPKMKRFAIFCDTWCLIADKGALSRLRGEQPKIGPFGFQGLTSINQIFMSLSNTILKARPQGSRVTSPNLVSYNPFVSMDYIILR